MGNGICCIKTCESPHYKVGWCREHYGHWETHGFPEPRPDAIRRRRRTPPGDLFWAKVDKHGAVPSCRPDLGPCWLWTGHIAPRTRYGNFTSPNNRSSYAHRWSYEQCVGKIPDEYQVDHLCRVRHCVNPHHLEAVTQEENLRRQGEAITHCPKGHEYTPENTHITPQGHRGCKACNYMGNAAKYAARKWERLDPDRKCVVCGKALPFTRRSDAKYCSDPCRSIASYAKEKPRRQARAAARKAARAAGDVAA